MLGSARLQAAARPAAGVARQGSQSSQPARRPAPVQQPPEEEEEEEVEQEEEEEEIVSCNHCICVGE